MPNSGTLSPNPWDLALSRQNNCSKLETLEQRIRLRRDATRALFQVPEWQGTASKPTPSSDTNKTRQTLANARQKMVLTKGSTIDLIFKARRALRELEFQDALLILQW